MQLKRTKSWRGMKEINCKVKVYKNIREERRDGSTSVPPMKGPRELSFIGAVPGKGIALPASK